MKGRTIEKRFRLGLTHFFSVLSMVPDAFVYFRFFFEMF